MKKMEKAQKLAENAEVRKIGSSYYFTIHSKKDREVILKNGKWNCDCEWFSIKGTTCSHILAARIKFNELKKPPKTKK